MLVLTLFFIFAGIAVMGGILVVSFRNPIYCAFALVVTLFALAGEYILLMAHFIAIVHIAVYAGAIMVLFLFVVMLLNIQTEERPSGGLRYMIYLAIPITVVLFFELGYLIFKGFEKSFVKDTDLGTVEKIGEALFSQYVLPFEIASIVLIVAMIGALYLSKKKLAVGE
jgi:NADH-quinone oxidoreductase subunit J